MRKLSISNHKLSGDNVIPMSCPKNHDKFATGQPDSIIIHFTAGRDAVTSAEYLCKDDVKASAHMVIGRKGEIYQLVDFDTVAWHAGESQYGGRTGYNKYSIGIELGQCWEVDQVWLPNTFRGLAKSTSKTRLFRLLIATNSNRRGGKHTHPNRLKPASRFASC